MRWKISIEGSDAITQGQRFEFEIENNFDDLPGGKVGLKITDGNATLAPDACSSWMSRQPVACNSAGGLILGQNVRIADQGHQNRHLKFR